MFISKYGKDYPSCGSVSDPCGSIFYVSKFINVFDAWNSTFTINIMDGQNATQNQYLPITFSTLHHIKIDFNMINIQQFNDWFPATCVDSSNTIDGQYMFQGGASLTITNLIITDYTGSLINSQSIRCRQWVCLDSSHVKYSYLKSSEICDKINLFI